MKHTFRLLVLILTTLTISRLGLAAGCAGTWTQTGEDYGGTQQCINYPGGSFIKRVFYTITFGNGHPENTYNGDSASIAGGIQFLVYQVVIVANLVIHLSKHRSLKHPVIPPLGSK